MRATSSGNTSAALPSRPTDFASPACVQLAIFESASASVVALSSRYCVGLRKSMLVPAD